jgi:hypothetical protein
MPSSVDERVAEVCTRGLTTRSSSRRCIARCMPSATNLRYGALSVLADKQDNLRIV